MNAEVPIIPALAGSIKWTKGQGHACYAMYGNEIGKTSATTSVEGMEKYLSSGKICGIGPI